MEKIYKMNIIESFKCKTFNCIQTTHIHTLTLKKKISLVKTKQNECKNDVKRTKEKKKKNEKKKT